MEGMDDYCASLQAAGFVIAPALLAHEELAILDQALLSLQNSESVRRRGGVYAVRNLLQVVPAVAEFAMSPKVQAMVQLVLGPAARPVRSILFDKTKGANWLVPWHQDLTICVANRADAEGYGPWTLKAGVQHVQPPVSILEQMLAVRIHLDDCDERNGVLRVLPGTHAAGRLSAERIEVLQREVVPVACSAKHGDMLLMRPLLLHASSAASDPSHRRVIHVEYAAGQLAEGLSWAS